MSPRIRFSLLSSLAIVFLGTTAVAAAPPIDIPDLVERHTDRTLQDRRWLHTHPELSGREVQTRQYVRECLEEVPGLEILPGDWAGGLVAILRGAEPGPTVAWRADMDGLPVTEETGLAFASTCTDTLRGSDVGVMHACGHDIHMSVGLGALRVMADLRDRLPGTLVWIFQPAEETGAGALAMLEAGAVEVAGGIDRIFALHDHPTLLYGQAGVHPGPSTANVDGFRLVVKGRGGHGAYPHLSVDPVTLAARIVLTLNDVVAREVDVNHPAVISVGKIQGGHKGNVIPDEVELEATVRTLDAETRILVQEKIERTVRGLAAAVGAPEPELEYFLGTPAGTNDPALSRQVMDVFAGVVGPENVIEYPAGLGGEDFGRFSAAVPGVQFRLGVGRPERPMSLHSPSFDPDERSVVLGMRLVAELLWDQVNRP